MFEQESDNQLKQAPETSITSYRCKCSEAKLYRVLFDGDDSGNYVGLLCQKCYDSDDKQFMICEERIS
jgi:hypothetical protein